eukprot:6461642-Amphidinium_carterae.1
MLARQAALQQGLANSSRTCREARQHACGGSHTLIESQEEALAIKHWSRQAQDHVCRTRRGQHVETCKSAMKGGMLQIAWYGRATNRIHFPSPA